LLLHRVLGTTLREEFAAASHVLMLCCAGGLRYELLMAISQVLGFALIRTEARRMGIVRTILVPLIDNEDRILDF